MASFGKRIFKEAFSIRVIAGVVVVYLLKYLLSLIPIQLDFLNVFGEAFSNFNLTDIYYHDIRDHDKVPFEDKVVLVNISSLDREGIARELAVIRECKPKAIGIDAFFKPVDTAREDYLEAMFKSLILAEEVAKTPNLVLGSHILKEDYDSVKKAYRKLDKSDTLFANHSMSGLVTTISDDDDDERFRSWRRVSFTEKLTDGSFEPAFALKLASLYDSAAYKEALARGNEEEEIYVKGNIKKGEEITVHKYNYVDTTELFSPNFDKKKLEGKIVIMGYLGGLYANDDWDDDKFFTAINPKMVGRGEQDMYGAVMHANIVSMVLNREYIDVAPEFLSTIIGFVFCYLNVFLFIKLYYSKRYGRWYEALTKTLQLAQMIFFMFATIYVFALFRVRIILEEAIVLVLLVGDITEIYLGIFLRGIKRWFKNAYRDRPGRPTKLNKETGELS